GPSKVTAWMIRVNGEGGTMRESDFDGERWVDVVPAVELADPLLHRQRCPHCPIWTREDGHHGITDGFDHGPFIPLDTVNQEIEVPADAPVGWGIAYGLVEFRRAFKIAKENR